MVITLEVKMKKSYFEKMIAAFIFVFFLISCSGSKEIEEKNAQLQNEVNQLKQQVTASHDQLNNFRVKLAEVVDSVDPLLLKEFFQKNTDVSKILPGLNELAKDESSRATIHLDDEQLVLRIKKYQGEVLFRSWIDTIADRNVIAVQHLKSTEPKVPGSFNLAEDLWQKTKSSIEKDIAAGKLKKFELKDAKMNFINKMRDIDSLYEKQVNELFLQYVRSNSYQKPKVDTEYLLNGQFRTGGIHTISFKVSPVAKGKPWAVIVELVQKNKQGEQLLKSFELNPQLYQKPYSDSFTVMVKNK